MQWSDEQLAIFDAFDRESTNLLVNASPGSGKTTLQNELWNRSTVPTVYLAFNNPIVKEARAKLVPKTRSDIVTINSLGHRACMRAFPGIILDKDKVYKLIRRHIVYRDTSKASANTAALLKLIALMKCDPLHVEYTDMRRLRYDYDLDWYPDIQEHAELIWHYNNADTMTIDFNDQLSYPLLFDLALPKYELVLGDEIQDFNVVQADLVQRINASRYVLVGDKRQSIYAFRGAMSNSVDYLSDTFQCQEMPMTLTYRCAKSIVAVAQEYYPHDIHAPDTAMEGIVRSMSKDDLYEKDAMVLCRAIAPLAQLAFHLLSQRIPCQIKGRDIGQNLVKYIQRLEGDDLRVLSKSIQEDMETNIEIAKQEEDTRKLKSLTDKWETLKIFIETCSIKTRQGLTEHIDNLFENGKGILLSTIHKSKGLEAEKVYLLNFDSIERYKTMLSIIGRKKGIDVSSRLDQETNCQYVAVTRAKHTLVYC